MNTRVRLFGFTLIELLIVVAIIAILAAIAVPNFLEAQVRAKVGRAKGDQRTIAMALESYSVDTNGKYPPRVTSRGGVGWAEPLARLTTPIAYMSSLLPDIFQIKMGELPAGMISGDYWIGGRYRHGAQHVMDYENFDIKAHNLDWQQRWVLSYGRSMWKIQSFGPMREVNNWAWALTLSEPGFPNKYYDPSNGTISGGLITRTQQYTK